MKNGLGKMGISVLLFVVLSAFTGCASFLSEKEAPPENAKFTVELKVIPNPENPSYVISSCLLKEISATTQIITSPKMIHKPDGKNATTVFSDNNASVVHIPSRYFGYLKLDGDGVCFMVNCVNMRGGKATVKFAVASRYSNEKTGEKIYFYETEIPDYVLGETLKAEVPCLK